MSLSVLRPNDILRVANVEGHWGRDPNGVMPPVAADAVVIVPEAQYGWDPLLGFWVPMQTSGGTIIEKFSELIATTLTSLLSEASSINDNGEVSTNQLGNLVELINTRLGGNQTPYLWSSLLGTVSALGFRKILGTDAGSFTATGYTISYTGVDLVGRLCGVVWGWRTAAGETPNSHRLFHIVGVTNPSGTPGTITLETPLPLTNDMQLVVPFLSVPHAYATTTDSLRVTNIAPEWSHYVEPTLFISQAAGVIANGPYQFGPIPCLDYGRAYFQIVWSSPGNNSVRSFVFNLYGKMDNATWAAAGAIPTQYQIHSWKQYSTVGQQFNGAASTAGIIVCRLQDAAMFDSLMVEMVVTASDQNNSAVTGYYGLAGAGR